MLPCPRQKVESMSFVIACFFHEHRKFYPCFRQEYAGLVSGCCPRMDIHSRYGWQYGCTFSQQNFYWDAGACIFSKEYLAVFHHPFGISVRLRTGWWTGCLNHLWPCSRLTVCGSHFSEQVKGSGAALLFLAIGIFDALSCLPFRADRYIWSLEE